MCLESKALSDQKAKYEKRVKEIQQEMAKVQRIPYIVSAFNISRST